METKLNLRYFVFIHFTFFPLTVRMWEATDSYKEALHPWASSSSILTHSHSLFPVLDYPYISSVKSH